MSVDSAAEIAEIQKVTSKTVISTTEKSEVPPIENDNGLQRSAKLIAELQTKSDSESSKDMFSVTGMLGDGDKIEDNQIDFVDQGDKTVAYFKTTSQMTEKLRDEIIPSLAQQTSDGTYGFEIKGKEGQMFGGNAWVIKIDENTIVYVNKGVALIDGYIHEMHGFQGHIKIEVGRVKNPVEIVKSIQMAFQKLQIPDALNLPSEQSESTYKETRYREQHKLSKDKKVELTDQVGRQEVFPGYFPVVDHGASEKYQKDGAISLFHSLEFAGSGSSINNIIPVLQHGLLSEHERLKRGKSASNPNDPEGKYSSTANLAGGRADHVFLRAIPADDIVHGRVALLIDPLVLDRTDWYGFLSTPSWREVLPPLDIVLRLKHFSP